MVVAEKPRPPLTTVEDIFRRSFQTERHVTGTASAYPDPSICKRELDAIRRFLGVTDRQLIRMVNNPDQGHGRAWFAPNMKRRPSSQYLLRMIHLVMLKTQNRLDIEHGWVLDYRGKPKWPLVSHFVYENGEPVLDAKGRKVVQSSYWETEWLVTDRKAA